MKKLLFMLMGVAATINVMAVDYTAKANLLLEATSGEDCEMYLRQSNSYSALEGYDMYMANREVALYAINGEQKLQMAKAADLTNLALGLKTDESTDYTITVSGVAGTTLRLFDLLNQEEYDLTEGAVINITAAANSTIEDRFVINYVAPSPYAAEVTTNAEGLATFSFDQALAPVEAGVKLYKGAVSGDALNLTQVADIAAEQGVIVYGEANTTYHFNAINGATANFDGNELLAASTWQYPHAGTAYVLSGSSLYVYEGENMKPNKAFLLLDANSGNAPRRVRLVFDQATGVENVATENVKAEKFIENGQVLIKRGEVVYNLQGQIVK
jgi:hypothetical protein